MMSGDVILKQTAVRQKALRHCHYAGSIGFTKSFLLVSIAGNLLDLKVNDDPFLEHVAMMLAPFGAEFVEDDYELVAIDPVSSSCDVQGELLDSNRIALTTQSKLAEVGCAPDTFAAGVGVAGGGAAVVALEISCGVERLSPPSGRRSDPADEAVPIGSIGFRDGEALRTAISRRQGLPLQVSIQRRSLDGEPWEKMLAPFSSRGPAAGMRIKPDVIAPGDRIVSSDAGTECSLTVLSGSSASTPLVGGAAAIVRQYMKEARGMSEPSGSLLKAIIVNGAVDVVRLVISTLELTLMIVLYCIFAGFPLCAEWLCAPSQSRHEGGSRTIPNRECAVMRAGLWEVRAHTNTAA